ncbi:class I SAM-dependent DNA methyltransferase [Streptococcus thermophilus]|uniref:DNA methyltransferase n=1 Tax=Streptococcus thermophilus TaxID=1308 RepID=UPI001A982114|nr:DNA methyltransferase [Streptococcus thermophilus]MBO1150955.1 class I SAM-dependent DNA methyltransferase [Streptococcus thermophilus]MBO1152577.1 class I SAM-dependent DNA methyltransferase [Streptococcus thermophilus]MBO1154187.1 class I SAM-dependent DNA methyltransferase [Streptococcus thermophilus]MBO1154327.1 class I SAM-dependent DNA methyltransferase [Streptococcus thermophilus]MBO1162535.1 class I SAM-dependent DNA methyltransferase [Streptococcus thermophilus]
MNARKQKKQAKDFIERWRGRGNERQDSQSFWLDLLGSVFGIENPSTYITFEDKVMLDHTSFIDGYIEKTKVLIEQKGANKDLNKAIKQSDGTFLSPFQQAKRYSANLPYSKRPRWIVTCNFNEFYIYDMEQPNAEAKVIKLEDLPEESYRLEFLIDKTNEHLEREMQISMQAGEIVGEIYEGLLKQYKDSGNPESLHAINQLIVRLVFCFYAEDSGLFGHKLAFHDYLAQFPPQFFRTALIQLFEVLDTPISKRDPYLEESLSSFPYVNGGMFSEKDIEIPNFTEDLRQLILEHASSQFDWSDISPTIFGAVFESTLNPETRHSGGMHYTSIENIHKVIDPLFLDDLKDELNAIKGFKQKSTVEQKAKQFQTKLASLTFFDPACGSGNFLTETYISLRRLENEAIKLYLGDSVRLDVEELDLVKVKLNQFYGIEINDFAVSVAKTALWIAESQMLEATKEIVYAEIDFLPLKSYTNIVNANALTTDWETVVDKDKLSYIIGNPPFLGYTQQTSEQKSAMKSVYVDEKGKTYKTSGKNDFVSGWYFKASELMLGTIIRTAFVSTNSITQGEQVSSVWKPLVERFSIQIDFAYRTFNWTSEAKDNAAVHCVIISFSHIGTTDKYIFDNDQRIPVSKINPYLIEGDVIFVENRRKPLASVSEMFRGSQPTDGGNLILSEEEKDRLLEKEPQAEKFIRPFLMGADFIKRRPRYCIWLVDAQPSELRKCPMILERVKKVKEFRESSRKAATRKKAETPTLFDEIKDSKSDYIAIPKTSSQTRRYIPIDFLSKNIIAGDAIRILPGANLFYFGVITSNVHMAWMRTVAGRMKSDYSYSNTIVYNNFPWISLTKEQEEKISQTAQAILDARALYPDSSLADLYDELTMPPELRKAHQANDKAVMQAYGMTKEVDGKKTWLTESETVARLFEMYEALAK